MGGSQVPPVLPPRPRPLRLARATAAMVAFVASVLGTVFLLWPSLKPEPPSPTRGVALSALTLERPVTFAAYLRRIREEPGGLEDDVLYKRGALVSFDFAIEGYKDRPLPLAWQLIAARGGDVLDENRDISLTPEAVKDKGHWHVWVPLPRSLRRRVFVQVMLFEPRGEITLKTLRTRPFLIR